MDQTSYVPPPPPLTGGIPSRRLQTSMPAEAPACVQNAMMTKDKKPFTYTPGGIDLSQIKSPRMAKRISRNARSEGITNQPKVSPLVQDNNNNFSDSKFNVQSPVPAASMMGGATGMPFQVFPNTPQVAPPPPPPPPKAVKPQFTMSPLSDPKPERKSPQNFEPPPFGCRPEIKIPPNPMSALKSAPRPKPKDDYWIEEYRREKLSSEPPPIKAIPVQREESFEYKPFSEQQKECLKEEYINSMPMAQNISNGSSKIEQRSPQMVPEKLQLSTEFMDDKLPSIANNYAQNNNNINKPTSNPQKAQPLASLYIPPVHEVFANSKQSLLSQSSPPWMSSKSESKETPEWVNKDEENDVIEDTPEIPKHMSKIEQSPIITSPVTPIRAQLVSPQIIQINPTIQSSNIRDFPPQVNPAISTEKSAVISSLPTEKSAVTSTLLSQQINLPHAQMVHPSPIYNRVPLLAMPLTIMSPQGTESNLQSKERIIPIQFEQSPVAAPSVMQFTPSPYIQPNNQKPSMNMPPQTFGNPNQFVNQGYGTYDPAGIHQQQMRQQFYQQQQQQKMNPQTVQPMQQPTGTRIIPIQLEGGGTIRGPYSQAPTVIQSDPRSKQTQGNITPNQSRSFRVLQKITDTMGGNDEATERKSEEVSMVNMPAQFSRQISVNELNDMQMKKSQDDGVRVPPSEQQVPEPKIYTGSNVPGRSFKMLQAMTNTENTAETNCSDIESNQNFAQNGEIRYSPYPVPPHHYCCNPNYHVCDPKTNQFYPGFYPIPFDPSYYGGFISPYPFYYEKESQPMLYYYPPPNGKMTGLINDTVIDKVKEKDCQIPQTHYDSDGGSIHSRYLLTPTPTVLSELSNEGNDVSSRSTPLKLLSEKLNNFNTLDDPNKNDGVYYKKYHGDDLKLTKDDLQENDDNDDNSDCSDSEEVAIKEVTDDTTTTNENEAEDEDEDTENGDELTLDTVNAPEHLPHQLSVIYEEDSVFTKMESRRSSITSNSSTLSDCSNTLANDEASSDDELEKGFEFRQTNEENSPKIMDEEVALVEACQNEINGHNNEDEESEQDEDDDDEDEFYEIKDDQTPDHDIDNQNDLIKSNASIISIVEDDTECSNDVSVTLTIPSKCNYSDKVVASNDDKPNDKILIGSVNYDADTEVSVSVSLPLRRKKVPSSCNSDKPNVNDNNVEIESLQYSSNDNNIDTEKKDSILCNGNNYDKKDSESECSESDSDDSDSTDSASKEDSDGEISRSKTIVDEHVDTYPVKEKSLGLSVATITSDSPKPVALRNRSSDSVSRLRSLAFNRMSFDESEAEDDSGVTDISKHISEIETDSENFPEMRKLTRYQRAATHSRLFKLLQDEGATCDSDEEQSITSRDKKAEITKTSNLTKRHVNKMETMQERRERLTLPIQQSSSGVESLSSSASSSSPVSGFPNEKLAEELVQSLLMRKKGRFFRNLPLEKLHAAAIKILQEDVESNGTISSSDDLIPTVDSTPAITPQEFKAGYQNSYADYYDTWNNNSNSNITNNGNDSQEVIPSKAFKLLQDQPTINMKKYNWSFRCPRVLSSKSISRLADVSESEIPELPRSRPLSRASNKSAELYTMSGLIDELPSSPRTPYKQFRFNN